MTSGERDVGRGAESDPYLARRNTVAEGFRRGAILQRGQSEICDERVTARAELIVDRTAEFAHAHVSAATAQAE